MAVGTTWGDRAQNIWRSSSSEISIPPNACLPSPATCLQISLCSLTSLSLYVLYTQVTLSIVGPWACNRRQAWHSNPSGEWLLLYKRLAIPSSSTQTTYAKRLVLARLPKKGLPRLRKIHLWHVQFTTFKSMVNHGRLGKSKCLRQCDSMHSYEYKRKYLYIYIYFFFSNVFLGWIVSWRNTFGAWFAATCAAARMPSGLVLFPQIMFSKFWSCAMRVLV